MEPSASVQRPKSPRLDSSQPWGRRLGMPTPFLKGRADDQPAPKGRSPGWHPVEWGCEFAGTAFQLFVGFGAVAAFESPKSPLRSPLPGWGRLVVIGICFGLLAAAVAISPLGRRSGAHLNPAVTLGFAVRGHTSPRDALGFAVAQTAGALLAAAGFAAAWATWAPTVKTARTQPEPGLAGWAVTGIVASSSSGSLRTSKPPRLPGGGGDERPPSLIPAREPGPLLLWSSAACLPTVEMPPASRPPRRSRTATPR